MLAAMPLAAAATAAAATAPTASAAKRAGGEVERGRSGGEMERALVGGRAMSPSARSETEARVVRARLRKGLAEEEPRVGESVPPPCGLSSWAVELDASAVLQPRTKGDDSMADAAAREWPREERRRTTTTGGMAAWSVARPVPEVPAAGGVRMAQITKMLGSSCLTLSRSSQLLESIHCTLSSSTSVWCCAALARISCTHSASNLSLRFSPRRLAVYGVSPMPSPSRPDSNGT
mmetsp:Transcript_5198/g.17247  ORF Transcript_5198/g.17247 Transcript_5198/m.17247 type:complete len:234 (-) Transcript_5198:3500-4201(-)